MVEKIPFVVDHAKANIPTVVRERLLAYASGSVRAFLGPKRRIEGAIGYDVTWRLTINVKREELRESAGLGRHHSIKPESSRC